MKLLLLSILFLTFNSYASKILNGADGYYFGETYNDKGVFSKDLNGLGYLYKVQNNDFNYDESFLYVDKNTKKINGVLKVKQTLSEKICLTILKQRSEEYENDYSLKRVNFDNGIRLFSNSDPYKNIAMSCDDNNLLSTILMDLSQYQ